MLYIRFLVVFEVKDVIFILQNPTLGIHSIMLMPRPKLLREIATPMGNLGHGIGRGSRRRLR